MYTSLELCAGAGGQALGLHQAGFKHLALIDNDAPACATLRLNNLEHGLEWAEIIEADLHDFAQTKAVNFEGKVDLVAGGVPCPPFSKAGKQLGKDDERDLFPVALDIVSKTKPKAVLIENVAGLLDAKFAEYRQYIDQQFEALGYKTTWKLLHASNYGVPQLRPRVNLVALLPEYFDHFKWPEASATPAPTVGEALYDLMALNGWKVLMRGKIKQIVSHQPWLVALRNMVGLTLAQPELNASGRLYMLMGIVLVMSHLRRTTRELEKGMRICHC